MKVIKFLLSVLLVAAVLFGGYYAYTNYFGKKNITPTVETVDIQGTINDIGELSTAEYCYKITQFAEKENIKVDLLKFGIEIPFTSSKVLYSYKGVIKAGILFNDVEITVNETQKKIYVRLPDAQIFSNELDNKSLEVYDEKYSAFNKLTFEDMNISQQNAKEEAEKTARESGLLQSAKENAETIISASIGSFFDLNTYTIQFY